MVARRRFRSLPTGGQQFPGDELVHHAVPSQKHRAVFVGKRHQFIGSHLSALPLFLQRRAVSPVAEKPKYSEHRHPCCRMAAWDGPKAMGQFQLPKNRLNQAAARQTQQQNRFERPRQIAADVEPAGLRDEDHRRRRR
jgi:hypothetical protein